MTHPFEQLFYIYDAGHRFGPPDSVWTPGKWPLPRVRPTEVPLITRESLTGKFWMSEKEDASFVIVQKAHAAGTYNVTVTLDDFEDPVGFLHLLHDGGANIFYQGLLAAVTGNPGVFKPTDHFWDRMVGQPQEIETKP
jgi:hypothetical protein